MAAKTPNDIDDSSAPLIEHLAELRTRLIWSALAFVVAMCICYAVWNPVYNFLTRPICQALEGRVAVQRRRASTQAGSQSTNLFHTRCHLAAPCVQSQIARANGDLEVDHRHRAVSLCWYPAIVGRLVGPWWPDLGQTLFR